MQKIPHEGRGVIVPPGALLESGVLLLFSGLNPGVLLESGALLQSGSQKENLR